jgi:hypothetical protein
MYTLILFFFLGLLPCLLIAFRQKFSLAGWLVFPFFGAIAGLLCGLFVALFVRALVPRHDVVYGTATLVSMRSADGISGTFILGTGRINSETIYNFMIKDSDGSVVPDSVPADQRVHIFQDQSLKDTGTWTSTFHEPDTSSVLASWALGLEEERQLTRQEFHVPVGAVVQQFNIS